MSNPLPEAKHFDPILRPDLAETYKTRAERLRALAEGHDLAEYLSFAALICEAQVAALPVLSVTQTTDPARIAADSQWQGVLSAMLAGLCGKSPAATERHLAALAALPSEAVQAAGLALVAGDYDRVDPAHAPLIWAALSTTVATAVRAAPLPLASSEESLLCPLCGSMPVASHIHTAERQGMRYLHCALCDCEWHMVRAKCSNCGESGHLDYLSFETPEAAIRAEACDDCGSYLKVISAERDADIEVVADDLASLALDDAAVAENYGRSGFNPFALPG